MIALIDYGAGNLASVANALKDLSADFKITNQKKDLEEASKIIFPGVGEATSAMKKIEQFGLKEFLVETEKPLLGICLGMQLLGVASEERNTETIGIFKFKSVKFDSSQTTVPHMGWNIVQNEKENKLFSGLENEFYYFAHSYFVPENENTIAFCDYQQKFSAAIQKDNFYGVQFHPEKSGQKGLILLNNFVELC